MKGLEKAKCQLHVEDFCLYPIVPYIIRKAVI